MAVRRRVVARCERRTLHAGGGARGSGSRPWDAGSGHACPGSWRMGSCTKDALRLRPASWLCWLVKKHCAAPGSSGAAPGAVWPQRWPCSAAPRASLGMPERVAPDPANAGSCLACTQCLLLQWKFTVKRDEQKTCLPRHLKYLCCHSHQQPGEHMHITVCNAASTPHTLGHTYPAWRTI